MRPSRRVMASLNRGLPRMAPSSPILDAARCAWLQPLLVSCGGLRLTADYGERAPLRARASAQGGIGDGVGWAFESPPSRQGRAGECALVTPRLSWSGPGYSAPEWEVISIATPSGRMIPRGRSGGT